MTAPTCAACGRTLISHHRGNGKAVWMHPQGAYICENKNTHLKRYRHLRQLGGIGNQFVEQGCHRYDGSCLTCPLAYCAGEDPESLRLLKIFQRSQMRRRLVNHG